jgi:6-phosphogluconate dehydrogenase, C-terminal domain
MCGLFFGYYSFLGTVLCSFVGMKGTGRWTIQEAAERNTPAPTIAAALDARYLSGNAVHTDYIPLLFMLSLMCITVSPHL